MNLFSAIWRKSRTKCLFGKLKFGRSLARNDHFKPSLWKLSEAIARNDRFESLFCLNFRKPRETLLLVQVREPQRRMSLVRRREMSCIVKMQGNRSTSLSTLSSNKMGSKVYSTYSLSASSHFRAVREKEQQRPPNGLVKAVCLPFDGAAAPRDMVGQLHLQKKWNANWMQEFSPTRPIKGKQNNKKARKQTQTKQHKPHTHTKPASENSQKRWNYPRPSQPLIASLPPCSSHPCHPCIKSIVPLVHICILLLRHFFLCPCRARSRLRRS